MLTMCRCHYSRDFPQNSQPPALIFNEPKEGDPEVLRYARYPAHLRYSLLGIASIRFKTISSLGMKVLYLVSGGHPLPCNQTLQRPSSEDISTLRPRSSFYRGNSPRTAGSPSTYNSPTTAKRRLPSIADSFDTRAEPVRPDLISAQKRMCVAVDFGTVLSGVACGTSANQVQQILWPGPGERYPRVWCMIMPGGLLRGARLPKIPPSEGLETLRNVQAPLGPHSPSIGAFYTLPRGKQPVDLITDYLKKLWENAKPRIRELGFTPDDLKSADIWISIPATWNVNTGEIMREAAYKAGLVAPQGSLQYDGGRDRLHIVSEPEAAAVHSSLWKELNLNPNQSFMVCDAGGGTVDTAVYRVLGNVTQIAERCASSGASCGSQFLDLNFRKYLEQWHTDRGIRLSQINLESYMHSFTYTQKIAFTGHVGHDASDAVLFFECYDTSDYDDAALPDYEFFAGQLLVPAHILREQVFEPVITKAIEVLEDQFSKVDSVDALLLVGGFSASQYLFDRIWDTFHLRLKDRIQSPRDPDIATSLGSAQYGLARSLVHRPLGRADDHGAEGLSNHIEGNIPPNGQKKVFKTHYLVVKGALLRKGVAVLENMTKFSKDSSDSLFVARLYASDSAEVEEDTSRGRSGTPCRLGNRY
ncbi:hypothetical protein BS47DRAFT_1384888 [Hydnum rufescens UP504]|uniref:Uncharacterized protein n=1 Tax=Hydnum rufescens UP504 TaxID=1448309 RepID=A0A9P6DRX5_9AGAM|nr:hypothetical protein BS47DRAFT_1384888 [Hydnum rufescens UP504]